MPLISAGVGAGLGALGGMLTSGPEFKLSQLGEQAQGMTGDALSAYSNLVGAGANAGDVGAAAANQRKLAARLGQVSATGMYDMAKGRTMAAQQFAGQRNALEDTFRDQLSQANRSASLAGRSGSDPILRARLAVEQSRQSRQMAADQGAAAMGLGRQAMTDQLGNLSNQNTLLQALSGQAFTNQGNMFNMASSQLSAERNFGMQEAQYEQSRGGGLKGALTGLMTGAGAGLQAGGGLGAMGGSQFAGAATGSGLATMASANDLSMPTFGSSLNSAPSSYTLMGGGPSAGPSAQGFSPQASPYREVYGPPDPHQVWQGVSSPEVLPRAGTSSPASMYNAGMYSWDYPFAGGR